MFVDLITEKDNVCKKMLDKCSNSGFPTYILGAGLGADAITVRFSDFPFAGKMVSKRYYQKGIGCLCMEDFFKETSQKVNIIVAFRGFSEKLLLKYKEKLNLVFDFFQFDSYAGNFDVDSTIMTHQYIMDHQKELEFVSERLEDDYSRTVLAAYINQKISMKYGYLERVKTKPQYFEAFIPLAEDEVFVDCGAYNGDSALAFIDAINKRGICEYKKILSFEPDPINYKKLKDLKLPKQTCFNKGVSDRVDKLCFSIQGTSSVFNEDGKIMVDIDTLDHMVEDDITFMKMDIEGAELDALKGASNLIRKCRPKLAVCIYHKKEDLWQIMEYLESMHVDYKYYIRAYEKTATELVLYAIPR